MVKFSLEGNGILLRTTVVMLSASAVLCTAWRFGAFRSISGMRCFGTSAAAATCTVPSCKCVLPPTIDPVVLEENDIEKILPLQLKQLHTGAVEKGQDSYKDPSTGFKVFTRLGHIRRGSCCGSRCRHCPYGHVNVRSISSAVKATSDVGEKVPDRVATSAATGAPIKHSVVYTKTGDKGTSALFTGERRAKTDSVFEALGELDELSSHIGLARAMLRSMAGECAKDVELMSLLEDIQQQLLNAGTVVATPAADHETNPNSHQMKEVLDSYNFPQKTTEMEAKIDEIDARLVPLRVFILPGGGNVASAQLHVCRTACRRAERRVIKVTELHKEQYTDHLRQVTVFVNRLSDFLFVAARSVAEEDIVRKYE